jgi:hypothetical protein
MDRRIQDYPLESTLLGEVASQISPILPYIMSGEVVVNGVRYEITIKKISS